jgi:phage head maturation protease
MPFKGGSTPIGASFSLTEDSIGLWMRAWIADTTLGRDILRLMEVIEAAGLQMGASVAGFPVIWRPNFVEAPRAWERGIDAGPGALLSFDLKEVSLAGFPALNSARVRLAKDDPASMIAAANERLARITGG